MPSCPRCLNCREPFQPDFRNRSREKGRQRYCSKPACQQASRRAAQRRYRLREPEARETVRRRVRELRDRQRKHETETAAEAPPKPSVPCGSEVGEAVVELDPGYQVDSEALGLADLIRLASSDIARLLVTARACNEMTGS